MSLIMRGETSNVFGDIIINDQILFDDWELEQNATTKAFEINNNGVNAISIEDGTGNVLITGDLSVTGTTNIVANAIQDTDNTTSITTEAEAEIIIFRTSGSEAMKIKADGEVKIINNLMVGADVNPALTLSIGDTDTGIAWASDGIISVVSNSAERLRFNDGSNGQIAMTVGTSNFDLTQSNASDGSQAMSVRRVRNNIDSRYIQFFKNTSTTVGALDDVSGTFSVVDLSDQRLKKNIVNYDGGYDNIKNISARCFDWNTDITDNSSCRGFIAQELMTAIPSCVGLPTQHTPEDPIEYFTMSRTALIPELWSCCKSLIDKVEELEARVEALES